MKVLPVTLIQEADAYTIAHEPIAAIDLMERAAAACCRWIKENLPADSVIKMFCGSGNNGGDGFAVARMMIESGYVMDVFALASPEKMSDSCRINFLRLQECRVVNDSEDIPVIGKHDVVIDAIFGNGLTRPPKGVVADVIRSINNSEAMVVAIDMPSGLFCDETTMIESGNAVIHADYTLTFAPPKLAFLFPENDQYVGQWQLLDIGLSHAFIDAAPVKNFMFERNDASAIIKSRNKFSHKGIFGHALLIAGSTGKMGAAVLSALGCMRSGAGLTTVRVPGSGADILQTAVPEAMLAIDACTDHFSEAPDLATYSAIAVGPGIGTTAQTAAALKILIQNTRIPLIFDADAINIIAENKTWIGFLPKESIFTPHPREFERLVGKSSNNFERNRMQRDFSMKNQCYVVLKGAHTAITTPDGSCFFNTTGNPGMATGGSGDVLTGIIAGLMAQRYTPLESCLLGVYIHGLAGDMALKDQGYEALIASDILINLGKSFQSLYGKF